MECLLRKVLFMFYSVMGHVFIRALLRACLPTLLLKTAWHVSSRFKFNDGVSAGLVHSVS